METMEKYKVNYSKLPSRTFISHHNGGLLWLDVYKPSTLVAVDYLPLTQVGQSPSFTSICFQMRLTCFSCAGMLNDFITCCEQWYQSVKTLLEELENLKWFAHHTNFQQCPASQLVRNREFGKKVSDLRWTSQ